MNFFTFGLGAGEQQGGSVELLGGKGAGLVWMATEGIPVPPGFVIPTSVWAEYDTKPKTTMKAIAKALPVYLAQLEQHFGYLPLLSVRSGARKSCPGMMDTILNVGLDAETTGEWINRLGPECFADSFQRLIAMYGSVVNGVRKESLEGETLKDSLEAYESQVFQPFPDAQAQLLGAIEAVFKSWDNERANEYRKMQGYDRAWGTAVTVQAMVFGNLNDQSGSGVLFTRNPDTGANVVTGEFLVKAQGEDIVAGIRTPLPLSGFHVDFGGPMRDELVQTVKHLETLRQDVQDVEFTVQNGALYILQTRSAKRSAQAALRIAVDTAKEGLVDAKTAVKRVSAVQFDLAQQVALDPKFTKDAAFYGIGACSGVVTGKPVFSKEDAVASKVPCILVRLETTPEDITGMKAAVGVVTMKGGLTSHAAVFARSIDRACIVGVEQSLDLFKEVEVLSLDGATGRIWTEAVPMVKPEPNGLLKDFKKLVCESLDVVPVLFSAPAFTLPEALLYLGDQVLNPAQAVLTIQATAAQVGKLYVDLVPSTEEAMFLNIFKGFNAVQRVLDMLPMALTADAASKVVVIAGPEYTTALQRLTPASDLRTLVMSEQEIIMGSTLDVADPAIAKVLAWKQQTGTVTVSFGSYVAGGKSVISVQHALQVIAQEGA